MSDDNNTQQQTTEPSAPEPKVVSLSDIIPEELAGHTSLKDFKSPQDLVKSYVHSQKMLGKGTLPSEDDPDDKWSSTFKKLGVPEKAEEYSFGDFDIKKSLKDTTSMLKEAFKEANITKRQAGPLAEKLLSSFESKSTEMSEKIKRAFGDEASSFSEKANTLAKYLPEEFKTDVENMDVNTRTVLGSALDKMLKELNAEDKMASDNLKGDKGFDALSEKDLLSEKNKLLAEYDRLDMEEPLNFKAKQEISAKLKDILSKIPLRKK